MECLNKKDRIFDKLVDHINKNNVRLLSIVSIVLIVVFLIPTFLIIVAVFNDKLEIEEIGQIGDAIGGIANPFIAIVAIFFSFLAFYMQLKANEQLNVQHKNLLENQDYELFMDSILKELIFVNEEFNNISITKSKDGINGLKGIEAVSHIFNEIKYLHKRYSLREFQQKYPQLHIYSSLIFLLDSTIEKLISKENLLYKDLERCLYQLNFILIKYFMSVKILKTNDTETEVYNHYKLLNKRLQSKNEILQFRLESISSQMEQR